MTLIYDQTWKTKTFFVFVTIKLGKGGEGNRESGELSRIMAKSYGHKIQLDSDRTPVVSAGAHSALRLNSSN